MKSFVAKSSTEIALARRSSGRVTDITARSTESSTGTCHAPGYAGRFLDEPSLAFARTINDCTLLGWLSWSQHSATWRLVTKYSKKVPFGNRGSVYATKNPVPAMLTTRDINKFPPLHCSSIYTTDLLSITPKEGTEGSGFLRMRTS